MSSFNQAFVGLRWCAHCSELKQQHGCWRGLFLQVAVMPLPARLQALTAALLCLCCCCQVCGDSGKGFVLINQKGIDPLCLDMLAKEGILALRRWGALWQCV
jgi:hypothetical protein